MALTKTVTKHWPTLTANGLFYVGVEVVLKDDDVEVRRRTFTLPTSKNGDVAALTGALSAEIQTWIDAYKTEQVAFNHAKYETLRSDVDAALSL